MDDGSGVYDLERILYQREINGRLMFLTKWLGYDDEQCTWEPIEHFSKETLAEWEGQREAGDALTAEEAAMVDARMAEFNRRLRAQNTHGKASSRKPSRQPKSESPATQSTTNRLQAPPSTENKPTPKRRQNSFSPAVKEEPLEHSEVVEQGTAKQPRPQKPKSTMTEAESAQGPPTQISADLPLGTKEATETTTAPSSLEPLTQGNNDLLPTSKAKQVEANNETIQASKRNKTSGAPTPKSKQTKQDEISTPARGKQPGSAHTASMARNTEKNKAGQRFKNLRQQNQFTRLARREPAPDISKLDRRAPNEWPESGSIQPASTIQNTTLRDSTRDSPLFCPEENETEQPQVEILPSQKENPKSSKQSVSTELPPSAISSPTTSTAPENPAANNGALQRPRETTSTKTRAPAIRTKSRDLVPSATPSNVFAERREPTLGTRSNNLNISPAPEHDDEVAPARPSTISAFQPRPAEVSFNHDSFKESTAPGPGGMTSRTPEQGTAGNLDVDLHFGSQRIGNVTLVGLPHWLIGKLRGARVRGVPLLTIHFKEKWVMNAQQFSHFTQNLHWRQHGNFWIQPHDDTLRATEDLSKYLSDNDLCAVWEYPQPLDSLILILLPYQAPGWRNFREGIVSTFKPRLQVLVRNKLPGVFLENDPGRANYVEPTTGEPKFPRPELRLSMGDDAYAYVQSPVELSASTPTPTTRTAKERANSTQSVVSISKIAPSRDSMEYTTARSSTAGAVSFSANFDDLFRGVDRVQYKPQAMICFGESYPAEAEGVKQWLQMHLGPRQIYIDTAQGDWNDFQDTIRFRAGAVLFHEQYRAYCDMEGFYKILRPPHVFCYEIPFPFRQMQDSNLDRRNPMTRLFPRGTILCITESTLIHLPQEAMWAMEWFETQSQGKPQSWKLVLPPDISSWILRRARESSGVIQETYIDMWQIVNRLQLRSLRASWGNGDRGDDPDQFVQARPWDQSSEYIVSLPGLPDIGDWDRADLGEGAVKARDNSFVTSFVGWTAGNATLYRRFIALDSNRDNKTEEHSWHIWFRAPRMFVEEEKKKEDEERKKKKKEEEKRQQDRDDGKEREDERRRA